MAFEGSDHRSVAGGPFPEESGIRWPVPKPITRNTSSREWSEKTRALSCVDGDALCGRRCTGTRRPLSAAANRGLVGRAGGSQGRKEGSNARHAWVSAFHGFT